MRRIGLTMYASSPLLEKTRGGVDTGPITRASTILVTWWSSRANLHKVRVVCALMCARACDVYWAVERGVCGRC